MRRSSFVAVLPLTLALSAAAVPSAHAATEPAEAVLAPAPSWQKGWVRAGGETATHVLVTADEDGTPRARLYETGGGVTDLGEFPLATHHPLLSPRLLGGVVALPGGGHGSVGPATVTFRTIASGAEAVVSIDLAAHERAWAFVDAGTVLVGKRDAANTALADLYLRTPAGDDLVMEDAPLLSSWGARVVSDTTGALVYDGAQALFHVDYATDTVTRVDDPVRAEYPTPQYLAATEIGYSDGKDLVRVPRAGGARVRVPLAGDHGVVRRVGDRLVRARFAHPQYELLGLPAAGGTETFLAKALTSPDIAAFGDEVAVFGLHEGGYGRLAVDPVTAASRMLAALPSPPAEPRGVALSGGRLVTTDDSSYGGRLAESRIDPNGPMDAFLGRREIDGFVYAAPSCNGLPCAPVAAFGSRTAYLRATSAYGSGAELVVVDQPGEIHRVPVNPLTAWFELGGRHLLYETGGVRRIVDLDTGHSAPSALSDVWGFWGYGVDDRDGSVFRLDLGSGERLTARAGDSCAVTHVSGRGPWVRWTAACEGGEQHGVTNVRTGTTTTVPAWARALGDGIAVGWNGLTLTALDLTAEGTPATVVTTGVANDTYAPFWSVDALGGRLVAWQDTTTGDVHVKRLGAASGPVEVVTRNEPGQMTIGGAPWQPQWDYTGAGVDWTLHIGEGTPYTRTLAGSAWDGAIRPSWNGRDDAGNPVPHGHYVWRLSVTPRDGSAAPADISGSVRLTLPTTLTLTAPSRVTYGYGARITATLRSNATALPSRPVLIQTRKRHTTAWQNAGKPILTGADGVATLAHTPQANAEYRALYAGDPSYDPATSGIALTLVAQRVRLTVDPTSGLHGSPIIWVGSVAPARSGNVTIFRLTSSGWQWVANAPLSSYGYFKTAGRTTATGRFRYRASVPGGLDHVRGDSAAATHVAYRVRVVGVAPAREYVTLRNTGVTAVNLLGWTLGTPDDSRYKIPAYALAAGATVRIYTGRGTNRTGALYLNRSAGIWPAHGTAYLYDRRIALSDRFAY